MPELQLLQGGNLLAGPGAKDRKSDLGTVAVSVSTNWLHPVPLHAIPFHLCLFQYPVHHLFVFDDWFERPRRFVSWVQVASIQQLRGNI